MSGQVGLLKRHRRDIFGTVGITTSHFKSTWKVCLTKNNSESPYYNNY